MELWQRPEVHARRWTVLAVMCLSLVMVVMAVSGLNVALPTLVRDLGASQTELQWIIDSYALVFAGLLLTAGALGDRFGRREALLGGLAVFFVGSLAAAFADTPAQVIGWRALMGVGASFVMPATLSIITNVFPPHERGRAIAIWAGLAGAGGALGPIVSGLLLERFWWGSVFLANLPVLALLGVLTVLLVPRSRDEHAQRLDPVGALLSLVGLSALLFAIIEGPARGWTDGLVVAGFVAAAAGIAAFLAWERRVGHPMLPLEFFRDRRFSVGAGVITLAFFAMFGMFFLITQYLQFVRGYSPLGAGLATLPLPVTLVLVAPRSAMLAERFGARRVITVGLLLVAAGFAVLATVVGQDSEYLLLAVALVLLGGGMSVTVAPATGGIMASIPLGKAGIGSAVNDTTREVGGALGIAVLGSIVASAFRTGVDIGGLPAEAGEAARESVGAAYGVAAQVGGERGAALALDAGRAFTDAFNVAMGVGAAIALLAAGLVLAFLPDRRSEAAVPAAVAVAD